MEGEQPPLESEQPPLEGAQPPLEGVELLLEGAEPLLESAESSPKSVEPQNVAGLPEEGNISSIFAPNWYRTNPIITVDINGKEVIAEVDPCSYYTILKECPEGISLGEELQISQNNGRTKETGHVIKDPIYINGKETSEEIIFVKTFMKNVIGWQQLHDLDLIKKYTDGSHVTCVPPVLISGTEDPKFCRPKHLNRFLIEAAIGIMSYWLRKGYIEKCNSFCNCSVTLGRKVNRNINFIIHYGNLNAYSEKESPHPRENLRNAFLATSLGKYYSMCRLFYGEWQIPLDSYTKYKTAFKFLGKQYAWNRVPTDYHNKNRRLLEGLEMVIDKLPENIRKRVTLYMDTILLSADSMEECKLFTDTLFQHLNDHNFRLQTVKTICQAKVCFLDRYLNENGFTLNKEFLYKAKKLTTPPTSLRHLQSILRFLTEARDHTPIFDIVVNKLSKFKHKSEFFWHEEEEEQLSTLKAQVLVKRFLVPSLGEDDTCTVQIFVKYSMYMARILNKEGKVYRYKSGMLKTNLDYPTQELRAIKDFWQTYRFVLEGRVIVWEVQSPEIWHREDEIGKDTSKKQYRLNCFTARGCIIKVVPEEEREPPFPWSQIP